MERRGWVLLLAMFAVACGDDDGAGGATTTTTTITTTTTEPTTTTSTTSTPQALDLRDVDWENATVPAAICGGEGTVRLRDGSALVSSGKWTDDWRGPATTEMPGQVEMSTYGEVQYGDIDGDGHDDAAVPLWCDNGGGTASGLLGQGLAIMSGGSGAISALGIVTPTPTSGDILPSYFDSASVRLADHTLTAEELRYGPHDATCCPSGRATSTWTYADGSFDLDGTRVTATPASQP